jgi:glycosyltransferase involved in cell wall biosynthesis
MTTPQYRILVLYRELAGYIMTSLAHLAEHHDCGIDVIAYPVNPEAPFQFTPALGVTVLSRNDFTAERIIERIRNERYGLILCGGWIDADYLKAVRAFPDIPSALGFDKQWLGSMRDVAAAIRNRLLYRTLFTYAFVPGKEQVMFARKMGFPEDRIIEGIYCCDIALFTAVYERRRPSAGRRKIWYTGRYVPQKGLSVLFEAIIPLLDDDFSEWELHCAGTGSEFDQRPEHQRIVHHGFCQPAQLRALIEEGDLFVLPSLFEPWGVVVHEFATAGYALIVSDHVGARTAFVEEGVNGYIVRAGDASALRSALEKAMRQTPEALKKMGDISRQKALTITPETFALAIRRMMH